jgi:uncharacterized membrane protein
MDATETKVINGLFHVKQKPPQEVVMNTRTTLIVTILLSLGLALAGTLLAPQMTPPYAIHWNARGAADGTGGTFEALYLLPLMLLGTAMLLLVLPRLDPMRTARLNYPMVNSFVLLLALFQAYLHALTLAWNLGYRFNMNQLLIPAMGLMFLYIGFLIEKAQPNWFVGIRTPWTLSNTQVWEKTHRLGGKLFKLSGLLALLGVLFPGAVMWLVLIPILAASAVTILYSYIVFRQIERSVS